MLRLRCKTPVVLMNQSVASKRPFLSNVWFHHIHEPFPAMPKYYKAAADSGDPDYIGAVEQWDAALVGLSHVAHC